MSKGYRWIAVTLVLLMGASCAPTPGIEPYEFEPNDAEPVAAELGTFLVPENRSDPESRQIALRFVRFASTAESPGPPIVYLAGGPGGSGIGTARGTRFPLFMALREFGDVIAFDQRGTGMSGFEELDCDDRYQVPFDQPIDRAAAGREIARVTAGCAERLRGKGIDVAAYNTKESAADLMALREFLGAEKIALWGISYGSHLALATLKYHGEHIDRAILAGLEGLHHSWKLPSDQQELMVEIARRAALDPAVNAAVPDLLGTVEQLLAELEREPKVVRLTHPIEGTETEVAVGSFDLQFVLAAMLRGPADFAGMPDALYRLAAGDWTDLALASAQRRGGEGLHTMSAAMDCASGASAEWTARIAREAEDTLLGDAINFPFPDVCEGLGAADLGDGFRAPVESDVPTLLISGTLDGRTPVANGEELRPGLANSQHLVIDGAGHSDPLFLSSPEILVAMQAFLRGETIASELIELPPIEFIAPRAVVTLSDEALDQYIGDYQIGPDDVRRVFKAGPMLFTRRGNGRPFPIRPTSETTFFYPGSSTHLVFERGDGGEVTGMVVFHDGSGEGEPARKTG